jgi:CTP synthase (UTP-ammonia lyase)
MPRIAVLGDRDPAHLTHREIDAALALLGRDVEAAWLPTEGATLDGLDGVWLAPGTPYRDDDAVYAAIETARTTGLPTLGTCGGFQYALVEFARNVAGLDAVHAETDPDAEQPLVRPLACSLYGEERTVTVVPGTRLAAIVGTAPFTGFHFCGFGLDPGYLPALEQAGLTIAAHADDAGVEAVELADHPFFVATLFQPQVGASAGALHPLLEAFVAASAAAASAPPPAPSPSA